jgi:hypothetical protein
MPQLTCTLGPYLAAHNITAYRLSKTVDKLKAATVYGIANGKIRPSLDSLEDIMQALPRLTGKAVDISELLKYQEVADDGPNAIDPQSRAWLDAPTKGLTELAPYPWEPGEREAGEPIRFVEGKGWLSGDEQ